MTSFRVRAHGYLSGDVIDVYDGEEFIAAIYSTPDRSVRVISKHAMRVAHDDSERSALATEIEFASNNRGDTCTTAGRPN